LNYQAIADDVVTHMRLLAYRQAVRNTTRRNFVIFALASMLLERGPLRLNNTLATKAVEQLARNDNISSP
jgi:hypothetical protein